MMSLKIILKMIASFFSSVVLRLQHLQHHVYGCLENSCLPEDAYIKIVFKTFACQITCVDRPGSATYGLNLLSLEFLGNS